MKLGGGQTRVSDRKVVILETYAFDMTFAVCQSFVLPIATILGALKPLRAMSKEVKSE